MPKKDERITAVHLMVVFNENIGLTMRWKELHQKMIEHNFSRNRTSISDNLKYLASQGEIVKYLWHKNPRYGMPKKRPDGTRYIIVKNKGLPDEIVELGK